MIISIKNFNLDQNRQATDQPWRDGMCGHTEYIVQGDK